MESKVCTKCQEEKLFNEFYFRDEKPRSACKLCENKCNKYYRNKNKKRIKEYYLKNKDKKQARQRYIKNKEKILLQQKEYYLHNREDILKKQKEYYKANYENIKERSAQYYLKNKKKIITRNNKYQRIKRANCLSFRLKKNISRAVSRYMLVPKHNRSILNYLPYSMQDLKKHLEEQFEFWMTWDNYGPYNVQTWDNNDCFTWSWQIDHIIPQSELLYSSFEESNFLECWSLDNLRPYSAKLNLLDGVKRVRHTKVNYDL